jgi:predicted dehydrogenase
MSSQPFTLNWGILGKAMPYSRIHFKLTSCSNRRDSQKYIHLHTPSISLTNSAGPAFSKDLLIPPSTRRVADVSHTIVAAASSTSDSRAREFLNEIRAPPTAKAYGSYASLVADPNIDIIYVATPHSHHYQHVRLCLEAGKHVLCEKAFTVNAQQAQILVDLAKKKGLFLMEAVWTRYFPISAEIREVVRSGRIGEVKRVFADLSFWNDVEKTFGTEHRMVNLDLAGGALLDCRFLPAE